MLHTIAFDEHSGAETYTWFRATMRAGTDLRAAGPG